MLLTALAIAIWFSSSGEYNPKLPPHPPLPNPNALDAYAQVGRTLKQSGALRVAYPAGFRAGPSPAGELALVATSGPLLTTIRSAASMQCLMPSHRETNSPYPWLEDIRPVATLLGAEGDVQAARGDFAGEASTGLDMIQIGLNLERGGEIVHEILAARFQAQGQLHVAKALDHLSVSQCDSIAARLRSLLHSRVPVSDIVRETGYSVVAQIAHYDGSEVYNGFSVGRSEIPLPRGFVRSGAKARWRVTRDRALHQTEAYFEALARQAELPSFRRKPVAPPTEPAVSSSVLYANMATYCDTADARDRLVLCALAICSYRLRHHRPPAQLSDAGLSVPETADPWSGRPFVYRATGGDYILYSVGPDGIDGGGAPADSLAWGGPDKGDVGIAPFWSGEGRVFSPYYRPVPHMLPPKVPPGALPLLP